MDAVPGSVYLGTKSHKSAYLDSITGGRGSVSEFSSKYVYSERNMKYKPDKPVFPLHHLHTWEIDIGLFQILFMKFKLDKLK